MYAKQKLTIIIIMIGMVLQGACQPLTSKDNFHVTNHQTYDYHIQPKELSPYFMFGELGLLPEQHLQKNDHGEQVAHLQQALNTLGYSIDITEVYDEMTVWAITDLQLHGDSTQYVTGIYDAATRDMMIDAIQGHITNINPGEQLEPLNDPDELPDMIENPYEILALVNKQYALPADYYPDDLVTPHVPLVFGEDSPVRKMRAIAAEALEEMFEAAKKDGHTLYARSGFRSYQIQVDLFQSYAQQHGEEAANKFSARPGESEHQTGLTMDITSPEVGLDLTTDFANTPSGKWVNEHASEFGFIIRYPEDKVSITEYQFEPWHLRYVGKKAAKAIMSQGITLEEYLNVR